jgi:hypothetical protein
MQTQNASWSATVDSPGDPNKDAKRVWRRENMQNWVLISHNAIVQERRKATTTWREPRCHAVVLPWELAITKSDGDGSRRCRMRPAPWQHGWRDPGQLVGGGIRWAHGSRAWGEPMVAVGSRVACGRRDPVSSWRWDSELQHKLPMRSNTTHLLGTPPPLSLLWSPRWRPWMDGWRRKEMSPRKARGRGGAAATVLWVCICVMLLETWAQCILRETPKWPKCITNLGSVVGDSLISIVVFLVKRE